MRTPRTLVGVRAQHPARSILPSAVEEDTRVETLKQTIVQTLEPFDLKTRRRVLDTVKRKLTSHDARGQCGKCGHPFELASGDATAPIPGDHTVCLACGALHQFQADMSVAPAEMPENATDAFRESVRKSQQLSALFRQSKADRDVLNEAELVEQLGFLNETLRGEGKMFLRFCQSVRDYELGAEPGGALMAMGRMFLGAESTEAAELADLLNGIEKSASLLGWERFAPNAKACFDYLKERCDDEDGAVEMLFARRWAKSGFPVFEMGHRTAASLMFTHGSGEIDSPWPAFMVKVPDGLVVIGDTATNANLARVLVLAPSDKLRHWELLLFWRHNFKGPGLLRVPMKTLDGELAEPVNWAEMEHLQKDLAIGLRRAVEMVGRLIAGACMLATADKDIEKRPWQPKTKSERRRTPGVEPPAGTRFIVTQNIELDLRKQVHEYISGRSRKGGELTVQFVVRGHRRWQAHGPKHSQRKLIWINPFWKGPEEGRALVRGYELKTTDT
jgi:transcription elongation factor Elf1